jgi:hypothetical protein
MDESNAIASFLKATGPYGLVSVLAWAFWRINEKKDRELKALHERMMSMAEEQTVAVTKVEAALVALITLTIVVYMLLLPPDERVKLLENDSANESYYSNGEVVERLVFKESPRTLDKVSFDEFEHYIPSINLFARTDAEVLKEADSLYAKNGMFDRKSDSFEFSINDLDTTDNVMISFNVKKARGVLTIRVNGNVVLNKEITKPSEKISVEKSMLDYENKVEVSVNDVGWAFWKTNEYSLENIMVTADITDVSNQESKNVFTLTKEEKENLERAVLKFFPDCIAGEVGKLDVFINKLVLS